MHRFITKHARLLTVAVTCLGIGAGASAIASAQASSNSSKSSHSSKHSNAIKGHHMTAHGVRLLELARHTVAGSFVVATKSGFATVTLARGSVESVSGNQLVIAEGTAKQSYHTVTLTLPATVRVRDNRQKATLAQVTAGQRATVVLGPQRALIVAHTPKHS